jgi:hypothetical protein
MPEFSEIAIEYASSAYPTFSQSIPLTFAGKKTKENSITAKTIHN